MSVTKGFSHLTQIQESWIQEKNMEDQTSIQFWIHFCLIYSPSGVLCHFLISMENCLGSPKVTGFSASSGFQPPLTNRRYRKIKVLGGVPCFTLHICLLFNCLISCFCRQQQGTMQPVNHEHVSQMEVLTSET